jgi:CheY-like chemotaxis protein
MESRKRLGEIFVEMGIVSQNTVDRMLVRAHRAGKRFGTLLEELELITEEELARAVAWQYGYKTVNNLVSLQISAEALTLIPIGIAMADQIFPLQLKNGRLALAMVDPTDMRVAVNLAANNNVTVVPFVTTRAEIHAAICRHYLGTEPTVKANRTVLIADDDQVVLTVLGDILSKAGYRVVAAADGMEAFKAVIAEKPNVIITDMEMPKLGGYGLLDAIKRIQGNEFLPVIMITGNALNYEEEAKALDKGFFDFIVKPVKEVALVSRVKRAFYCYDKQHRLY